MTRSKALPVPFSVLTALALTLACHGEAFACHGEELASRYAPGTFSSETFCRVKQELVSREYGPVDAPEPQEIPLGRYFEEIFEVSETDHVQAVEEGRVVGLEREVRNARYRQLNATRVDPSGGTWKSPLHELRLSTVRGEKGLPVTRVLEGQPPAGMGWLSGVTLASEFDALLPEGEAGVGDTWKATADDAIALLRFDWLASLFDSGGPGRSVEREALSRSPQFVLGKVVRTLLLRGDWEFDVRLTELDANVARFEVSGRGAGPISEKPRATRTGARKPDPKSPRSADPDSSSGDVEREGEGQSDFGLGAPPAPSTQGATSGSEFEGELTGTLTFDRQRGRFVEVEAEGQMLRIHSSHSVREGEALLQRTVTGIELELKWKAGE